MHSLLFSADYGSRYIKYSLSLFNMLLLLLLCIRQKTHQITHEDVLAPQVRLHQIKTFYVNHLGSTGDLIYVGEYDFSHFT